MRFSERMACPNEHAIDTEELEPRSFSFNSPFGACTVCHGLGTRMIVDPELVIPDEAKSITDGAISPWTAAHVADYFTRLLEALADELGFSLDDPVGRAARPRPERPCSADIRPSCTCATRTATDASARTTPSTKASSPTSSVGMARPRATRAGSGSRASCARCPCLACDGARLKPTPLAVTIGGKNIAEICALPIDEAAAFLADDLELTERERQIAERVVKEINERLRFLLDVGLDYLSLNRPTGSLSGGEAQRIRLATQIGAGLVGVLYVLDEPSIGLHQRDNHRLIETLVRLKDLGNTLIVVEHDEDTIRHADWAVDIGPGAGEHGGQVVVSGPVEDLLDHPDSLTGKYLSGRAEIPFPAVRRPPTPGSRARRTQRQGAQPARTSR